jgi:predicted glycosyl hydrolase (DUF1957 family)
MKSPVNKPLGLPRDPVSGFLGITPVVNEQLTYPVLKERYM